MNFFKLIFPIVLSFSLLACQKNKEKVAQIQKQKQPVYNPDVIYGEDNRKDFYEVQNPLLQQLSLSTVALVSSYDMTDVGDSYLLNGTPFGQAYDLCPSEPFLTQPTTAFCSGFLVAPNIVVSAGHCISNEQDCRNSYFVFDYAVYKKGEFPGRVSKSKVFQCKKIIHTQVADNGSDFSVIELDRAVTDRTPLKLRQQDEAHKGDPLVVMGHPSGLPLKIADGAKVRDVKSTYLVANLDTYGGNSGSAVINTKTLEVEGILVRGEMDFIYDGIKGCQRSKRCPDTGCRGEDVTKISEVLPYLPEEENTSPSAPTTFHTEPHLKIPDNNPLGVSSKIFVPFSPYSKKVNVFVHIQHSWIGDLQIALTAPDGTTVLLHNRKGRSLNQIQGTYGKDLSSEETLTLFSKTSTTGTWTLTIKDLAAWDEGTLVSWGLEFEPSKTPLK
ncbi:MAG: hypothetical protein D6797_06750 [Bdellovibrio sp.]|nr:MAG: hypothetical protein D6797_06750 [Bdellovibrio sp.]